MQFTALFASAALLATSALSSPTPVFSNPQMMVRGQMSNVDWASMPQARSVAELEKRDVWVPPVTSPKAGDAYKAGDAVTVTWDTSSKPDQVTNPIGKVVLGFDPESGEGGYNLKWTLAEDFNLDDGEVEVTLPSDVATRDDYIIVLFGDSGNKSDRFSITGTAAEAPAKRDFYRDDMIVA